MIVNPDPAGAGVAVTVAVRPGTGTATTAPPYPSDGLPTSPTRAATTRSVLPDMARSVRSTDQRIRQRIRPTDRVTRRATLAPVHIASPTGPSVDVADDATVHVAWDEPDWFGPGRLVLPEHVVHGADLSTTVAVDPEHGHLVFRIEAHRDLDGLASGTFERPGVGWPVFSPADRGADGIDPAARALAFLGCEFALPTRARADLDGWPTLPGRPATAWPLLVRAADGRTLVLAPLDEFHEQIIGIGGGTLRCGWHGDLDTVPAGFATELALIAGDGPRACLDAWGRLLLDRAGTRRPGRRADALTTRPSYWTDNGAAYWYRTEPGHDAAGSVVAAVDDLRVRGVPLGAVQLDSWWYPHAATRPFDTDEWEVPPTPMIAWEERPDVLPDGIADLRRRLGDPPLVAHIRHLAAAAPMCGEVPVAIDGDHAIPTTPTAYERWLDQCVTWGVETFEHDWLVEAFHRNRWLRERPGRARAWQEGIDAAARDRGITLQWCMATPADFARTTTLTQVTSIRTSGDHGYMITPGQLWAWFLTTNALARSLGLTPFKDVFRADPDVAGNLGEPEALLSVLSTGPVGLGDRVGRFDADLARRCCRADGVLVTPDVPVAATDGALLSPDTRPTERPVVAECWTDHAVGRWGYVLAAHCRPDDRPVRGTIDLAELGETSPTGDAILWDGRSGAVRRVGPAHSWDVELEREGWCYHLIAPVLEGDIAVIGDVTKFVPAGDARIEVEPAGGGDAHAVRIVVKGAGETVTVTGWSTRRPRAEGASVRGDVRHDPATGVWQLDVHVPSRGWSSVQLRA